MSDLFPACVAELEEGMRPTHYRALTGAALRRLNVPAPPSEALARIVEDVREKLLCAGRLGTFYLGAPYCLAGLRRWFRTPEVNLFHEDTVKIPGDAGAGVVAAYEALQRGEFMVQKNPNADPARLHMSRSRGLVVEQHVFRWALTRWPEFVMPPENHGKYERWCDHDMRLEIGKNVIKVDVANPALGRDTYGAPRSGGKRTTDLHLLARVDEEGRDVLLEGVQRGTAFGEHIVPALAGSPAAFVVWLDCLRDGVPYDELTRAANGRAVAS